MHKRLQGKAAIVTGAGSNLGRAVALAFANEGAAVAVVDIDQDIAAVMARLIVEGGGVAIPIVADVGNEQSVSNMIDLTVRAYGRIDILHNNAVLRHYSNGADPIRNADPDEWLAEFQVNILGPVLGCKYAVPHMIEAGGGSIINISSVNAMVGDVNRPQYGAAKAALNNLTMSIACLYGPSNIRCNAIAPGLFPRSGPQTNPFGNLHSPYSLADRHQVIRRRGHPDDVANLALFLASDEASFITGRLIPCDGGLIGIQHFDYAAQNPLPGEQAIAVPWS